MLESNGLADDPLVSALRRSVEYARSRRGTASGRERTLETYVAAVLTAHRPLSDFISGQREPLDYWVDLPRYADVVGFSQGTTDRPVVVIEVKAGAAINWSKSAQRSQLTTYAQHSPQARLVYLATDESITNFHNRGSGEGGSFVEFESYPRWKPVSFDALFSVIEKMICGAANNQRVNSVS